MKARIEAGKIVKYNTIPNVIYSASGTVENAKRLSSGDLEGLGFYDVIVPTYDSTIQSIHNLHFQSGYDDGISTRDVFIYDVRDKDLEDISTLKSNKIAELKKLANTKLSVTDWVVVRNAEKSLSIPSGVTSDRDAIRSTVNTKEAEINSLNTQKAVIEYDINF